MATYGYSAGYQGGGPQPVAPGFIEGYAQAGRSIGAGIQSIGSAIGGALQRYGEKKAENEFLTQRLESLAPYLQSMAQSGNVMDERSPESKILGDIEKFSSMSIPQKKATLLNAEFYLDRLDKQKARELQDLQAEAARFNLQTAQDAEARRRGLEQAISQVAQLPATQEVSVPAPPAIISSSMMLPSEQQPYTPFYQVQQIPGAAMQTPPAPQVPQGPTFGGFRFGGSDQYTMGLGRNIMPIPAGTNRAQFTQAPGVQTPPPAGIAPIPQRQAPLFESAPIQRTVTETQPVGYQDRFKQAIDVFQRLGAPINPDAIRSVLEATGTPQPTTVEQVGNIGSVVRFGDKEQFVPNPKTDIGDILKVSGITINSPEFRGQAPTEAEAKDFREQYATNMVLRQQVAELLDLTKLGKTQLQTPENKAKAQGLSRAIKATMRKEILGAGVVSEPDQKILDSIIPDPSTLFSWPSANRTALENLVLRANSNLDLKAKAYGLQSISPRTGQAAAAPSGGVLRWNTVTKKLE